MNIKELGNLAKSLGGVVVMDGDEPGFVVVPFDKYKKHNDPSTALSFESEPEGSSLRVEDRASHDDDNGGGGNNGDRPVVFEKNHDAGVNNSYNHGHDGEQVFADGREEDGLGQTSVTDQYLMEKLNKEIEALKEEIRMREAEELD